MPKLTVCTSCGVHTRAEQSECSHCGTSQRRSGARGLTLAAALLGLAASGCDKDPSPTTPPTTGESGADDGGPGEVAEPMYGVPASEDGGDEVPEPEGDEGSSEPEGDESGSAPEPPMEALYGVPASEGSS